MKPSLRKILNNDWPALFATIFIPMIWVINFIFPLLRKSAQSNPVLACTISIVSVAVLSWRITRVVALFRSGEEAIGTIMNIKITRDRGRIDYVYEVAGEQIVTWCPVHKSKDVMSLKFGQKVPILYDPKCPKRSLIKSLFAS